MKIIAEHIDALVMFKDKGNPKPYKFRYSDKGDVIHEIKIDKIIQEEETRVGGIKSLIYRCQSEIEGNLVLYELKYLISECRWELYKM